MTEKSTHIEEIKRLGSKCATLLEEKYYDKKKISELATRCAELVAENIVLHRAIKATQGVIENSDGVAGWHSNGDIAAWEEILPEVSDIDPSTTNSILWEIRKETLDRLEYLFKWQLREVLRLGDHHSIDVWKVEGMLASCMEDYLSDL
ncbi:hypothetical protein [Escherichia coli]|uniref:hypothetical protein n=1 Tax=Escherichia coli TaxID=562 RepID=UPI000E1C5923|nr:hypothetical protein [Escherichia coli]